jgi:D-methionine transport system substrate-binding protein
MRFKFLGVLLAFIALCSTSCSKKENSLRVAATSVPHAEMLNYIKGDLAKKGIDLEVVVVEDFNTPNRALADREVDANFFQHEPFMNYQAKEFGYPIEAFAKIHLEPLGLYSTKIKSLQELKDGATIAIPNDPTNEARALMLLNRGGLIALGQPGNLKATILNIKANPKGLHFEEIDAAMLPRTLPDVDAAIINSNFALQAKLPPDEVILREDASSPYANIIAIRKGDEKRPELIALKEAMTSDKMRKFILAKYKGAIIPAF